MEEYGLQSVKDDSATLHAGVGKQKGLQITLDQVTAMDHIN